MSEYHGPEEIVANIENLSRADLRRVTLFAGRLAEAANVSAAELMSESIQRIYDGRRKTWKKELPTVAFLFGVMKSVSSEWREKHQKRAESGTVEELPTLAMSPEEELLERERREFRRKVVEEFEGALASDDVAKKIYDLLATGNMIKSEICKKLKITEKTYDAKRKKMRRLGLKLQKSNRTR